MSNECMCGWALWLQMMKRLPLKVLECRERTGALIESLLESIFFIKTNAHEQHWSKGGELTPCNKLRKWQLRQGRKSWDREAPDGTAPHWVPFHQPAQETWWGTQGLQVWREHTTKRGITPRKMSSLVFVLPMIPEPQNPQEWLPQLQAIQDRHGAAFKRYRAGQEGGGCPGVCVMDLAPQRGRNEVKNKSSSSFQLYASAVWVSKLIECMISWIN